MRKFAIALASAQAIYMLGATMDRAEAYTLGDFDSSIKTALSVDSYSAPFHKWFTTQTHLDAFWTILKAGITDGSINFTSLYNSFNQQSTAFISAKRVWSAVLTFDVPTQTVSLNGSALLSAGGAVIQDSATRAVPGPIAGAGLAGSLALLGFLAWRRKYAAI